MTTIRNRARELVDAKRRDRMFMKRLEASLKRNGEILELLRREVDDERA